MKWINRFYPGYMGEINSRSDNTAASLSRSPRGQTVTSRGALRASIGVGLALLYALASATLGTASATEKGLASRHYSVFYNVRIVPNQHAAQVSIRLGEGAQYVSYLQLRADPKRHQHFQGDGTVKEEPGRIHWIPPPDGGELRYTFQIDHLRDKSSYDSCLTEYWALFRGDELVPAARVRSKKGAEARARLQLQLPNGWSVATPYPRKADGTYLIDHPDRRFDRPTGWMVVGRIGVLRERIAGSKVTVAGPVGQGLHRHDTLALLRWTLPTLKQIVTQLPERILIVGAGDPMWRGGLSGPNSLYLHAGRPLITSDGTSPLLHELMHTVMRARSGPGGDWIVEGLAELYSLELLVRSGTISESRYKKALARLERRGREVRKLAGESSSATVTARAVGILRELDQHIRQQTNGKASLDHVLRAMIARPEAWTLARFQAICERVAGMDLEAFFRHWVPEAQVPLAQLPSLIDRVLTAEV